MKTKNLLRLSLVAIVLLGMTSCYRFYFKPAKAKPMPLGQTAPPDMVFIPGDGRVESFYLSVMEEPNINYLIYLKYLRNVFGESYPEVYLNALPQKKLNKKPIFNDPYLTEYMNHPALSYYPVTGLSWVQIQNYLEWKTDRLNEAILIKEGFLNTNPEQKDEDNFNTEAYLFGQYQGSTRKNLKDNLTGGERSIFFEDGILFPGFRLPTEAEWEYANQAQFQRPLNAKSPEPFHHRNVNHPFGQDYYPLLWGRLYGESRYIDYWQGGTSEDFVLKIDLERAEDFSNLAKGNPKNIYGLADYDRKVRGVINMKEGVREWLMDQYQPEPDTQNYDLIRVFNNSGFAAPSEGLRDANYNFIEKDSLGRMRDFRILGVDRMGKPLLVDRYHAEKTTNQNLLNHQRNQLKMLDGQLRNIRSYKDHYNQLSNNLEMQIKIKQEAILELEENLEKLDRVKKTNWIEKINSAKNEIISLKRQLGTYDIHLLEEKRSKIKNEIELLENRSFPEIKRVVRGGTWENPSSKRAGLPEHEAFDDVGFRVVLPYVGNPSSNSVKWGKGKWKRW